ncbi:VOC family protein [Bacillus thuringiensis]|uniref:VOC family protein n=1 Tax=Bacillus cereus group TaxID=86661 RepID=UPI0039876701
MIKGLYEAHLPVSNIEKSITFYESLELELAFIRDNHAFFWIEKGKSWLGLWEVDQVKHPYHASIRHVAFQIDYKDMKETKTWLKERNIEVVNFFNVAPEDQPVLFNANSYNHAAIYFEDPDGNLLEFICPF